jgi:hypothetical protein
MKILGISFVRDSFRNFSFFRKIPGSTKPELQIPTNLNLLKSIDMKFFCKLLILIIIFNSSCFTKSTKTYVSRHNFQISYPSKWFLYNETIENNPDFQDADSNYFQLTNYNMGDIEGSCIFEPGMIKIEIYIYPNFEKSLYEWINSSQNVSEINDFTINGKKAYKVMYISEMDGNEELSIYYLENKKAVEFDLFSYDTKFIDDFYKIVKSFSFISKTNN